MGQFDVIVIGGGNAALCAAIAARHNGARVLLLERAPQHLRGGNTRHTRNIRCAHAQADEFFSGSYTDEEYLEDLIAVTGTPANLELAQFAVRETNKLPEWMSRHGAIWQQPLTKTLHLGRTNRWFLGGGKALLNAYYRTAGGMGVGFRYDAFVEDLCIENGRFEAVVLRNGDAPELVRGGSVVVACGGFEANLEWLKEGWGEAASNFIVRGTPYNDGRILSVLLAKGAHSIGDLRAVHAIAVDARAPKYDSGIVSRLDSLPFGIVVNQCGMRFYDEGEEIWPKRYAIWGGLIMAQPEQIAYSIVDSKTIDAFMPPLYRPYQADTLRGLGELLAIDIDAFVRTVEEFNRAAAGNDRVHMQELDHVTTRGISPPKSNWALPIDRPPFYGFPLRAGLTFTYMGVAVDSQTRVLDKHGSAFKNVYAAGEIMSGNILTRGYLGGLGMAIGSIFGRLAGKSAARNDCT